MGADRVLEPASSCALGRRVGAIVFLAGGLSSRPEFSPRRPRRPPLVETDLRPSRRRPPQSVARAAALNSGDNCIIDFLGALVPPPGSRKAAHPGVTDRR